VPLSGPPLHPPPLPPRGRSLTSHAHPHAIIRPR
jgi:hypothetical protein